MRSIKGARQYGADNGVFMKNSTRTSNFAKICRNIWWTAK